MTLICIPRSPNPDLPWKGYSSEMVRRSRFIGVGVGIGIDSPDAIVSGLLSDCEPTLAKPRQHGAANFKNILHRAAFKSRPSGHLEEPARVAIGRLATPRPLALLHGSLVVSAQTI
jgi:hypothetical protein